MNTNSTFSKTEAGLREIQSRSAGFPIRLRQILIMIDGQKRFDDLLGLQPDHQELNKQLQQLMELKLIVNSAADNPLPVATQATPAPIAPSPALNNAQPLPRANARLKIRRIMAMTDQAYLSNKLEFMLSDVFDVMTTTEDLNFCIERWKKTMQDAGHTAMVDAYLLQIRSAMAG